jgi:hypothetical protein
MKASGEVLYFFDRGYGFVVGPDHTMYFLHATNVINNRLPVKGDKVLFEVGTALPGKYARALNVEIISAKAGA